MLNELAAEVHSTSVSKGWWSSYGAPGDGAETGEDNSFLEAAALVASEAFEAIDCWRKGMPVDELKWKYKSSQLSDRHAGLLEFGGNAPGVVALYTFAGTTIPLKHEDLLKMGFTAEPCGVPDELADVIIRVLDTAAAWGVDIDEAVREKMAFNKTREHRHGGRRA